MAEKMLSELFAAARSPVLQWDGLPAYAAYELDHVPDRLFVEFVAAKATPVQGLRLKIRGGRLVVNQVSADDLVLWRDTSPDRVEVQVQVQVSKGAGLSLKVWNVWRGGLDVTQAWLGNAGMRVESSQDGRRVDLRCSDGVGPVAFGDLEVRLLLS